ncbi:MAG: hypothetical protein PHP41_04420 [Bacilli bacterium]|jgi:hypothetical protein|nr:hypothetical protein [Bacilli bacterium]MDY0064274.1 hypothetical protein [Bacilli bacterium]
MQFIIDNFEYIAILFFAILVLFSIIILIYVWHVSKFFSNRKFRIFGTFELDPKSKTEEIVVRVFNNNVNDSYIIGFGFIYKEQTIDYYKTFFAQNNLDFNNQLIVVSRDSLKFNVSLNELKTIILDYNKSKKNISMIKVYAIDSLGLVTKTNAQKIRRVIVKEINGDRKDKNQLNKQLRKEEKREIRAQKTTERKIRNLQRKERWMKRWLIIKTKIFRMKK